ncbi:MAG: molybdopterin-dependent oxidoreductase, partial [Acidimicrobiales bacterium]
GPHDETQMTQTPTTIDPRDESPVPVDPPAHAAGWAALAGFLAAAAALATGEIMSGFSQSIPSLVVGVAEIFTAETPGGIVRWSINAFGTSQKNILTTGIVITTLGVGTFLGVASLRNRKIGIVGFAAFGVLGGWAGARAALSADGWSWLSAILATAVGIGVLLGLLKWLPFSSTTASGASALTATPDRRNFLTLAGGAGFFAIFGMGIGRSLRNSQSVEGARQQLAASLATTPTPATAATPVPAPIGFNSVDGISPLITPNEDFYLIDTAIRKPQIDPATWEMRITGMVDNEVRLGFDDLLAMDQMEETITLSCVSNRIGGDLVGNAVWTGVSLASLLEMAGVQPGADQIVGRSVDGWTGGFPTEVALDGRPAMVALTMNGEPLPISHGFPARLVIPGLYGYVSATKWLSEVELTTWEDFDGYWIPRGWGKEGPIKTQSRIDVPRDGQEIPAGPAMIAGVAWAPHRSVETVEIQIDDGEWIQTELSEELSTNSWRQWMVEWDAVPGEHFVSVRATDGDGVTQTDELRPPAPDGATGHHNIAFEVTA